MVQKVIPAKNTKIAAALGLVGAVGVSAVLMMNQGTPNTRLPAGTLPVTELTPGRVLNVTPKDVCVAGYSGGVRNVPESTKAEVYREYGISSHAPGQYEVDHLISLELGGSNDIRNLWPQSYLTKPWNAHEKDKLENRLHQEVCSNQLSLADAQREISTDWTKAYVKRFGQPK